MYLPNVSNNVSCFAVPKKRKQAELNEGELETTISAGDEGKKRPKLSDLDEVSREYAVFTQKHFRSQLGNVEAFPDGARVISMFGHAWRQACAHFEEDRPPTKLIKSLACLSLYSSSCNLRSFSHRFFRASGNSVAKLSQRLATKFQQHTISRLNVQDF